MAFPSRRLRAPVRAGSVVNPSLSLVAPCSGHIVLTSSLCRQTDSRLGGALWWLRMMSGNRISVVQLNVPLLAG